MMFDPSEVHSTDEITGKDHWLIPIEDGQEVTVIPMLDSMFEAAQWNQDGYGVRVAGFLDKQGVLDFIEDVRGNWGLSRTDFCQEYADNGSCIHSEHTK
jgi:hypothetical protein